MCWGCMEDSGGDRETYPDDDLGLRDDILNLYERHGTGGALHVLLDDMNLEDLWFGEERWDLARWEDECGFDGCLDQCESIRDRLATFTEPQRNRIVWDTLWS